MPTSVLSAVSVPEVASSVPSSAFNICFRAAEQIKAVLTAEQKAKAEKLTADAPALMEKLGLQQAGLGYQQVGSIARSPNRAPGGVYYPAGVADGQTIPSSRSHTPETRKEYVVRQLFSNYNYDPTLTPAARKKIEEPKIRQFEKIYRQLAATLVYDLDSKDKFYDDEYWKLPEPKNLKEGAVKFTKQTKRGQCWLFALHLSYELDNLGINNWIISPRGEKEREPRRSYHAANLFEYGGQLFVSDLTLSAGEINPTVRKPSSNPIPYQEYRHYLTGYSNKFGLESRPNVKIYTPDGTLTNITYKEFFDTRNELREEIRSEKKTKLSAAPKNSKDSVLQTDAMLK
jgi:hypothetical protein